MQRLHQEDFCQAHAFDAERKYEERHGLSLRQCAQLLERWSPGPEELERLLDIVTLNVLVGNGDAHAKNLSVLHAPNGEVRLAPAYDVMSTIYYPNVSTTPAMFVNDVRDITAITRADLIAEAVSWGRPEDAVAERVDDLLARAEEASESAARETNPPDALLDAVRVRFRSLAAPAAAAITT